MFPEDWLFLKKFLKKSDYLTSDFLRSIISIYIDVKHIKPFNCSKRELSKEFADLANFLRILGEDNRLKIICLLKDNEYCVGEIVENLRLPQNLVSTHLKILTDLELLGRRQERRKVYYSINNKGTFKKYNLLLNNFFKKL